MPTGDGQTPFFTNGIPSLHPQQHVQADWQPLMKCSNQTRFQEVPAGSVDYQHARLERSVPRTHQCGINNHWPTNLPVGIDR